MAVDDQDFVARALAASVESLQSLLAPLGVVCRGIAAFDSEGQAILPQAALPESAQTAQTLLLERVAGELQLSISRDGGAGYLVACPLLKQDESLAYVFVFWLDALSEQTVAILRLAMGWLHLPFLQSAAERGSEALHLLEVQAHVFSQEKARAGAQEWVNRMAQVLRHQRGERACSVMLFRMRDRGRAVPLWWVTSDTATAEKGTTVLHAASDAAARVALEYRALQLGPVFAFPVLNEGEVVGVVVAECLADDGGVQPVLQASASVIVPLLVHWQLSERGVWAHLLAALREVFRKLREPGFLTWKAGAAAVLMALGLLLLVPFDDHASAKVVVEGQQQQVMSAPFEGYWAEVLVRPGDSVKLGQLMARLDTRDLKVEREKLSGERDQASSKLRQAFAEADSAAVQQASAQLRQADAQLSLVDAKLQRAEIRAPADGFVISGDWYDQIGSPVEAGKKLFEIAAGAGYRVVLQVPEEEIARVDLGQQGEIRVTGLPQKQFGFRVNRMTAVAVLDERKNTFRVEARLNDQHAPLRPGMQGVGKIVVAKSNLLSIWMRPVAVWLRMKLWAMWW
jgi:RND family efflux transporter MFP subunit